ncbi:hypothetical protein DFH09DRAFT_1028703 [Mycena vulgaris]|nr:hypothetical protein DFH09DRAFT_1028703 [Mycena vulgaris]
MAFVPDLHRRIEEISLTIERQKEILRDLENRRSDLQSDLNNIRDPMARLPLEISSDIFMCCTPHDYIPNPHPTVAPMLLMRVCRAWSKIAISTPLLWATISVEYRGYSFTELMDLWLSRARSLPLSIALHGYLYSGVEGLLRQHGNRIHDLELYLRSGFELTVITMLLPSLTTLVIGQGRDEDDDEESTGYSRSGVDCIGVLRAAPVLVDCTIHRLSHRGYFVDIESDRLTHSNLKKFRLDGRSTFILRSLTLPALESLVIWDLSMPHDDFLAFLIRSSPPLNWLELEIPRNTGWSASMVEGVFRLLPSLSDLRLSINLVDSFLEVLVTASPPHVLPHLRNLTINNDSITRTLTRSQYEKLISILSTRRASRQSPMQTLQLDWQWICTDEPDADIIVAFRQLVADGMEIHIGGAKNLI